MAISPNAWLPLFDLWREYPFNVGDMRFGMALFLNLEKLCSQNKEQQAVWGGGGIL